MKTKPFFQALISTFFIFSASHLFAQTNSNFRPYWEFNANAGLSTFFGDIRQNNIIPSSNNSFSEWKYGGGIMFGRQISPVFGLRAQLLTGELLGGIEEIDRYFESNYYEGNLNTTINLNNLIGNYNPDRKLNFYLVAGVGLTNYNSVLREISTNSRLRYQGYGNGSGIGGRTLETVLTGGLGIDFKLSERFSINLESVTRGMNSDMMDIWEDGTKYDMYNYTSLGISYRFGKKKKKTELPKEEVVTQPIQEVVKEVIEEETEPEQEPVEEVVEQEPEVIKEPVVEEKPVEVVIPKAFDPEYRVQIRASFRKQLPIEMLSQTYNINAEEIKEDIHNGYYIYTIGSMETYEEARALRDRIRSVNNVRDAFVVAFSKGKRLHKLP